MTTIHPTAIVHPKAELGEGVSIGPYSIVGAHVRVGPGTSVGPHVVLAGRTRIGARNRIFQFASIGEVNQDLKYRGEETRLVVGDDNTVREYVTMQIGTVTGRSETTVGSRNLFMVSCHVAHDCEIGDDCILANSATLAGHIRIESGGIIGGLVGVHQFCRIGAMAIVGGCSKVVQDVPPYMMADGHPARVCGVNLEGLRRKGFPREAVAAIKAAHKALFHSSLNVTQALARLRDAHPSSEHVAAIVRFVEGSSRGVAR